MEWKVPKAVLKAIGCASVFLGMYLSYGRIRLHGVIASASARQGQWLVKQSHKQTDA